MRFFGTENSFAFIHETGQASNLLLKIKEEIPMATSEWKKVRLYQCPCGYKYEPDKGDRDAGWNPGTPFEQLPDQLTCPRCQRAKIHFREKRFSTPPNK